RKRGATIVAGGGFLDDRRQPQRPRPTTAHVHGLRRWRPEISRKVRRGRRRRLRRLHFGLAEVAAIRGSALPNAPKSWPAQLALAVSRCRPTCCSQGLPRKVTHGQVHVSSRG